MKIYYRKEDLQFLRSSFLFLDTNALIIFVEYPELFSDLFNYFSDNSVALTIIPAVNFEYSRANSLEDYKTRVSFLNNRLHVGIYPIEQHLDTIKDLIPILHTIKGKNLSYPDFLLYASLYRFYGKSYLLSANHKDFISPITKREYVLSLDNDKEIHSLAVYSFSFENYQKAAENILRESTTDK